MAHRPITIALFWVLGVPAVAFPADGKEFRLKYRLTMNIVDEVAAAGQPLTILDRAKLKEEPVYNSAKPIHATVLVGANQIEVPIVLDSESKERQVYERLYVDVNKDGKLTSDERLAGWQRDTGRVYGPAKLQIHDGTLETPQWFIFQFVDYEIDAGRPVRSLVAINAGYYLGTVSFGDQQRRLALIDHNGNGLFNDYTRGSQIGDRLLIDLNGDGEFDVRPTSEESQPLGRYVLVGDRYWQLDVAADGATIKVEPLGKPLGTLSSSISEFALQLRGDEGDLRVRGVGGVAKVPAGKYALVRCQFLLHDEARRRWVFTGGGEGRVNFEVSANSTTKVTLGPPLIPRIEVTRIDNEKLALTLSLHGAGGESYNDISYGDGIRPPVPKVRLFDSASKELGQLDFHYG